MGTKCEVGSEYLSIIQLDFKPQFFSISGGLLSHTVAWYFSPKCIITIMTFLSTARVSTEHISYYRTMTCPSTTS